MLSETGIIYKLPNSDRKIITAGIISINDEESLYAFPVSSAVYLAGPEDFIFLTSQDSDTPLMAETWNPLLLNNKIKSKLIYEDNISKYFFDKYLDFLYSRLLQSKFTGNKVFTGPPLTGNHSQEIRLLFRAQEKQLFLNLTSINTKTVTLTHKKHDNSN